MRKVLIVCLVLFLAGCGQEKTTADWIAQLRDTDAARRLEAVKELGKRETELEAVVPALAEALKDANGYIRRDAAVALGKLGPGASSAVSALRAAEKDKERSVRKAASDALEKIGAGAKAGAR
ncbi:MAG: HEAT repeat domain-containing protein [Planctomycetes bacterium]|nr:HEAT repeat domain-containing protein [Planctomycetota bacterium]